MTKQHREHLRDFNRAMLWQWDRLRGLTPAERVEGHKLRIQPMTTKKDIYLHFSAKAIEPDRYAFGLSAGRMASEITITPVYLEYDKGNPIPTWFGTFREEQHFEGLQIHCYMAGDMGEAGKRFYGECLEYHDVHSIDLSKAKAMAQYLGRIDRAMNKINTEEGYSSTFQEYVMRLARAMKAKGAIRKNTPKRESLTGYEYQKGSTADLRYWIDEHSRAFDKACEPKQEAS